MENFGSGFITVALVATLALGVATTVEAKGFKGTLECVRWKNKPTNTGVVVFKGSDGADFNARCIYDVDDPVYVFATQGGPLPEELRGNFCIQVCDPIVGVDAETGEAEVFDAQTTVYEVVGTGGSCGRVSDGGADPCAYPLEAYTP